MTMRAYLDPQPVDCPQCNRSGIGSFGDGPKFDTPCITCAGSGKVRECPECDPDGYRHVPQLDGSYDRIACYRCRGTGTIPAGEPEIEVKGVGPYVYWFTLDGKTQGAGPFDTEAEAILAALDAARARGAQ